MPNKYRNVKVEYDGHKFDSRKEAERYIILRNLSLRGDIQGLEMQKKFVLIPAQRAPDSVDKRGRPVKGKIIEYECAYYADFCYFDNRTKIYVVEDVKSKATRTEAYKIKKKLMLKVHGIRIKEV